MAPKPTCIIITGRPGSGKTTLSKALGKLMYLPVISRDAIKEGYVNTFRLKHDKLPGNTNGRVSDIFFNLTIQAVSNKVSLIIEAAFQHKTWEPRIATLRQISEVHIIICTLDAKLSAQRHLARGLADPNREFYHGDKQVSLFKSQGIISLPKSYHPPTFDLHTIEVSTIDGYSPPLAAIKAAIMHHTA